MSVSALFVTYKMYDEAIQNIKKLRKFVPDAQCILVDNSPQQFKAKVNPSAELLTQALDIEYIDNPINNRFVAYNIGVKYFNHAHCVFRTDDDKFNEHYLIEAIDNIGKHYFAVSPHSYNGSIQFPLSYQRPIESTVFKTRFLSTLLPFKQAPSSDWELLKLAYETSPPYEFDKVICQKREHGRMPCH